MGYRYAVEKKRFTSIHKIFVEKFLELNISRTECVSLKLVLTLWITMVKTFAVEDDATVLGATVTQNASN